MIKKRLNWITLFFSIIFWVILFLTLPIEKAREEKANKVEWSIDKNDKNYMFDTDNIERYMHESNKLISLDYFGISILVYGFAVFILILLNKQGFEKLGSFSFIMINSLLALLVSGVYFSLTCDLYFKGISDYKFYFWILGVLPIIVLTYQIMRIIFKWITKKEPIFLVGDIALFNDPLNWLFRTSVLLIGILLGFRFDLIERVNILIMHLA